MTKEEKEDLGKWKLISAAIVDGLLSKDVPFPAAVLTASRMLSWIMNLPPGYLDGLMDKDIKAHMKKDREEKTAFARKVLKEGDKWLNQEVKGPNSEN
jgi:hypothetical protein